MSRYVKVRPGKGQSMVGFFGGLVFIFIGVTYIIPIFSLFGVFWTLMAVIITAVNGYNAFSGKGVATHEITIDDLPDSAAADSCEERLRELQNLYDKNLITEEEYQKKRQEILNNI